MKVIPPITITPAMLTSSSIAEPDTTVGEAVWVSGATYPTVGTLVILTSTHKVYYKLNTNVSTNLTVAPNINTADWLDIGYTNRWAMFDNSRTTGSASTTTVTVVVTPSIASANSIALVGCVANSVVISVSDGVSETYNYTTKLTTRYTTGWYKYFYGYYEYRASVVLLDIPPSATNVITITFDMPASSGTIGNIIIGTFIDLGDIQINPVLEVLNFSKVERDTYGNSLLVPRRSVPKTAQKTFIPKTSVNKLIDTRKQLNAVPAVWIGIEDNTDAFFDPLLVFGVYKEFSISMDYPSHAIVSLQLEEM